MALTEQEKDRLAKELAQRRAVMGDSAFQGYLTKVENAIPQVKQQRYDENVESQKVPEKTPGILGAISRFTGVDALGRGLAAGINAPRENRLFEEQLKQNTETQNNLIEAIKKARAEGKDTSRLEKALTDLGTDFQAYTEGSVQRRDLGVSNREVIGSAIRTAGTLASAGQFGGVGATTGKLSTVTAPTLTSATTAGRGILQGAGAGMKAGAASGAIFGGVSGLASGVEQNKGVLGTAFEVAKQSAVGGVLGGMVSGAVGAAGGALQARANRAQELKDILTAGDNVDDALSKVTLKASDTTDEVNFTVNTPKPTSQLKDRATAGFKVENGKVVADKKAQTLLKQGVQDTDVAIMQSFSPDDVKAAKEMVSIAKETARTGLPNQRQHEIVGKAFMQRAKDVEKLNKTAGGQIDDIARGQLAGKPVNAGAATDDFFNQLERDGVDIDLLRLASTKEEIAQAFEGSSYEGLDTVQKTLKTVLKRVDPDLSGANMDGLALHRAKRFIDNQVTYGKNAEGLIGDAERLLKGLRINIDDVLDTTFPDYNVANTQYKETIEALDEMRRLIGKDYLGSGNITDLKAGEAMTRLLGGATAKPMSALQNLENVSRKYGNTYSNSVMKQVRFADLLDDIYETVQKGSLQGRVAGGVAQGIDQSVGFVNRLRQGGLISATIDTAGDIAKGAAGITPEARQKAIEEFLGLASK
jgi:hypothetical protein